MQKDTDSQNYIFPINLLQKNKRMKRYPYSNNRSFHQIREELLKAMKDETTVMVTKVSLNGIVFIGNVQYRAVCRDFCVPLGMRFKMIGVEENDILISLIEDSG